MVVTRVLQSLGKLLFRMESRESRDFKIDTPYLAAAIKGTTFTVEVDDDDAAVEVSEGSVLVTANRSGQSAYVGAGERAEVGGDRGDAVQVSDVGDTDGEDGRVGKTHLDKLDGRSEGDTNDGTTSSTEGEKEGSTTGEESPTDPDSGTESENK